MSNDLRKRLRSLRTAERSIAPDKEWILRTRKTLLMQVTNTLPAGQMSWAGRTREALRVMVTSKFTQLMRKPAMAMLSIVLAVSGGSIISVSAAERSLPGDFFYGLKLVTEQARLALTSGEDRLTLKTEFTQRRVSELKEIASNPDSNEQVGQVAETLKRDLKTIKDQLTDVTKDVTPAKAVAAAKMVDQKTNQVISDLQETKAQMSPENIEKVTDAQSAAADTGVKAIEVLAEKHGESSDNVPASDIVQAIQEHTKVVSEVTPMILPAVGDATTTTSTMTLLPGVLATSTTFTTSTLPEVMVEVKDMTEQAFAMQKVQDQLDTAASTQEANATSTDLGTGTAAGTSTTPVSSDGNATATPALPDVGTTGASTTAESH